MGTSADVDAGLARQETFDLDVELADASLALECEDQPQQSSFRRLGSSREQFNVIDSRIEVKQEGGAEARSGTMANSAQVKPDDSQRAMGSEEHAASGEGSGSVEAAPTTIDDLVTGQFKLMAPKMIKMISHTAVKPPIIPSDESSMAQPVHQGDGDAEQGEGAEPAVEGSALDSTGVSELSLEADLPSGTSMANFGRIRGTINSYADKLGNDDWFPKTVLGTLHALHRRLQKRGKDEIIGKASFAIQKAYYQLDKRIESVIELHKLVKYWVESQSNGTIKDLLVPFSYLLGYQTVKLMPMSEQLNIMFARSVFHAMVKHQGSIKTAIDLYDPTILLDMVKIRELKAREVYEPPRLPDAEVKREAGEDGGEAVRADSGGGAAGEPKRKKHKRTITDISNYIQEGFPPTFYFERMVADSLTEWFCLLPESKVREPNEAYGTVSEISDIITSYTAKAAMIKSEFDDDVFMEAGHFRNNAVVTKEGK
eukprot:9500928-Pyramimonas_sp.AAC.1